MNDNKILHVKTFNYVQKKSCQEVLVEFITSNKIKREDILCINESIEPYRETILYYYK